MAEVVMKVDLIATFARMKVRDSVEIEKTAATESNVRSAASRYSKENGVEFKVSAPLGSSATKVIRIS